MAKKLVACFSASGITKKIAANLAAVNGADLFEIVPVDIYTKEDLDYTKPDARSTVEMKDLNCRPAISAKVENIADYDTVFIGFPVWWGREPSIIDTFIDETDLAGKTIVPFCTSGAGDAAGATARMKELCGDKATVIDGVRFAADISEEELKSWAAGLGL